MIFIDGFQAQGQGNLKLDPIAVIPDALKTDKAIPDWRQSTLTVYANQRLSR